MPSTYRCPMENADAVREGKTRYVAPRGAGMTILRGAEPVGLKDITDGTSNTIIFIDAGDEQGRDLDQARRLGSRRRSQDRAGRRLQSSWQRPVHGNQLRVRGRRRAIPYAKRSSRRRSAP